MYYFTRYREEGHMSMMSSHADKYQPNMAVSSLLPGLKVLFRIDPVQ